MDAGYKSARSAAEALAVPISTYNAHERAQQPGGRDYGPDEAERYARRFRKSAAWLLTGRDGVNPPIVLEEPEAPYGHMVPVKGYVGAGAQAHFYAVDPGDLDEVPAPPGSTTKTVAAEIRGDSLGELFNQWLVFYDDVRSPVTPDLIGKLCICGLVDGRVLVKKLRAGRKGLFTLVSAQAEPIENVAIEWAARVKAMTPR